ncbi:MAG TPA: hypothetical protein VJL89_05620 [Thermodesulfovibrionia bacterium]|nr:hypothetical protein [Thermodesulfovibrionia bacterium]
MSKPDELWKKIIKDLFEDFIGFFMPDLYPHIDFSMGYTFLDKELHKLFPKLKGKKRYPDHLVKVHLKDGAEQWILIHIEVQGYVEDDFSVRMFTYFYRIFDKYQQAIAALCIFIDSDANFNPARFEYEFYQTRLVCDYRTYKLLAQDEQRLIESDNPFAMAALAGLYHLKSGQIIKKKLELKIKLLRLLLSKGFSKDKITHLFLFLDSLLTLPEQMEKAFEEEVKNQLGGKESMGLSPLDSPFARKIYLEGHKEGEINGLLRSIQLNLTIRFGSESLAFMKLIEKIKDIERLQNILEHIIKADTIEEVKGLLQ